MIAWFSVSVVRWELEPEPFEGAGDPDRLQGDGKAGGRSEGLVDCMGSYLVGDDLFEDCLESYLAGDERLEECRESYRIGEDLLDECLESYRTGEHCRES